MLSGEAAKMPRVFLLPQSGNVFSFDCQMKKTADQ